MGTFGRIREILLAGLAVIGGLAILTLMVHVFADVALRNFFNQPVPATYEIVTHYYMVALAFVPLAWLERSGGMITVEVTGSLMGPRATWISDKIVAVISTAIYAGLAWVTFKTSLDTFAKGTFVMAQSLSIPTWPAYFLPPLGFALAAAVTISRIFEPFGQHHENWTVSHYGDDEP